jgi:hypothetical protein
MAEYDSDAGDISLSNPSSSSQIFHPPRPNDVTTPTPQRLFGKNLWANPKPQSVSLNEEDEPTTPLAGSSPWSSGSARPSSAVPSSSQGLADDPQSTPTPRMPNRRTSSSGSLTRSRSLNIRVPSVDLSTSPSARGPSSATSRTPSMRLGWSRRPGEPRPPPLVNEEVCRRMQRWVTEIVVCNFDLERGPVVERRAVGRRWGVGEKENV